MSNRKGVTLPEHGPRDVVFAIGGPIAREELPSLCERFRVAARGRSEVVCDVRAIGADLDALDVLARVALTAKRLGCRVRVRGASDELCALAAFLGLDCVL
jgi:ABC-type transporter Mla MlaB component